MNFQIRRLPLEQIADLRPLLLESRYQRYRLLGQKLKAELAGFWLKAVADQLEKGQAILFVALDGGKLVGALTLADNPWETQVLEIKAGMFDTFVVDQLHPGSMEIALQLVEAGLKEAFGREHQYLFSKVNTDDIIGIHALETLGFHLMDTLVDNIFDFRRCSFQEVPEPVPPAGVRIRLATGADMEALVDVTKTAFRNHFGRFHVDRRFGSTIGTNVYVEWIRSAVNGFSDWICVAEMNAHIIGYSTWSSPTEMEKTLDVRVGHSRLVAVHPDYSGRGIFTALAYEGMKRSQGVSDVIICPTHINNYGVQMGLSKVGWRIMEARHSFHKWLDSAQ
ncbi:MAG: GNAT family N-acetyltransferase [Anaerolineales bacterium]|nr:GNAT family N-acetyltransferase [Anaerolineales bacterium]